MRVLIVDDDAATRTGLCELVAAAGYDAIPAGTLQDAVRILAETDIALLVTDLRLTDGNGLQLVSQNARAVPTIVLTGVDDPVFESQATREGAIFIVKPVSPAKLLEEIRRVIGDQH